jgi:hypothetical protein
MGKKDKLWVGPGTPKKTSSPGWEFQITEKPTKKPGLTLLSEGHDFPNVSKNCSSPQRRRFAAPLSLGLSLGTHAAASSAAPAFGIPCLILISFGESTLATCRPATSSSVSTMVSPAPVCRCVAYSYSGLLSSLPTAAAVSPSTAPAHSSNLVANRGKKIIISVHIYFNSTVSPSDTEYQAFNCYPCNSCCCSALRLRRC